MFKVVGNTVLFTSWSGTQDFLKKLNAVKEKHEALKEVFSNREPTSADVTELFYVDKEATTANWQLSLRSSWDIAEKIRIALQNRHEVFVDGNTLELPLACFKKNTNESITMYPPGMLNRLHVVYEPRPIITDIDQVTERAMKWLTEPIPEEPA